MAGLEEPCCRRAQRRRTEERDMVIEGLDAEYYEEGFVPLLHELAKLPPNLTSDMLEAVVDERSSILEVSALSITALH